MLPGRGEAPPKTPILDEFHDPVRTINTYQTTCGASSPSSTLRSAPSASFKKTITPAWIESHLVAGGYYCADGTKAFYDDLKNEKLYKMNTRRQEQRKISRPSTFFRDQEIRWPQGKAVTKSANFLLTKFTPLSDSLDYEGIIEKTSHNSKRPCETWSATMQYESV